MQSSGFKPVEMVAHGAVALAQRTFDWTRDPVVTAVSCVLLVAMIINLNGACLVAEAKLTTDENKIRYKSNPGADARLAYSEHYKADGVR